MSEESNTHSDSPSDAASPTLDDASLSSSRHTMSEQNSIRKVSFPEEETDLVTGYHEPPNPWQYAQNVTREELISRYTSSCLCHGSEPLVRVLQQLKELELDVEEEGGVRPGAEVRWRSEMLDLKGEHLGHHNCEPLEEILKRLQFHIINLEDTFKDDEASVALFDMVEYYEAAKQLNISSNNSIGPRGWQACSQMLKKTRCLEKLVARNTKLSEQLMPALCRGLRISTHLQILHLENCNLSGRSILILVNALKTNTALKELHLADNDLGVADASHVGDLLRANSTLQLLDVSNNNLQDRGVGHLCDGLVDQATRDMHNGHYSNLRKDLSGLSGIAGMASVNATGLGLGVLILWNNQLTKNSSFSFYKLLANSKTLDTLNIGHNMLTGESLLGMKGALQQSRSLERLGLQSTRMSCEGAIALAECIADNPRLQRIDLRDNPIQIGGLMALALSMKVNTGVTRLDLDDNPKRKLDGGQESLEQYHNLVKEIREYSARNAREVERKERESRRTSREEKEAAESVAGEGMVAGVLPTSPTPSPIHTAAHANSRKISLTCETLLRSTVVSAVSTGVSNQNKGCAAVAGGNSLAPEPRRGLGVGVRLRSPAPSPVPSPSPSPTPSPTPSPHSSPVPSPSRSRFHVSKVTESPSVGSSSSEGTFFLSTPANLTMSPYSTSLSPSPDPSSSSISIPTASGVSSRFKVTLVSEPSALPINSSPGYQCDPLPTHSAPTVVTSSTSNVTVGFKFNVQKVNENQPEKCGAGPGEGVSDSPQVKEAPEVAEDKGNDSDDQDGWNFDEPSEKEIASAEIAREEEAGSLISRGACIDSVAENEATEAGIDAESADCMEKLKKKPSGSPLVNASPSNPQPSLSQSNSPKPHSVAGRIRKFSGVIPPHNLDAEHPPRIQSSLEKLLGLFQHPTSFFGKSSCPSGAQSGANQGSSAGAVGFFFGPPSTSNMARLPSSEIQQIRNSPATTKSTSFSSALFSNVMQEVSAIRSVFPGSQTYPEPTKPVFSFSNQSQCSSNKTLTCSDSESEVLTSNSIPPPFSELKDGSHVQSDCPILETGGSQWSYDIGEDAIAISGMGETSDQSVSIDSALGLPLDSTCDVSVEGSSGDGRSDKEEKVESGFGSVLEESGVASELGCSGEEQMSDSSSGITGLSSLECSIDKDDVVHLLSPSCVLEREASTELISTCHGFPDPNCNTYSDESIDNVQAVKNNELDKANKFWCKTSELTLGSEKLGQNLQLDILATCLKKDSGGKEVEAEGVGCASIVGVRRKASGTVADVGSASANSMFAPLEGQQD